MDEQPLVLIVEDNEKNLKLARDLLQYNGLRTIEAMNATDGIALTRERLPDVVLMDIQLPDMDGVSALRAIRADDRLAGVPIVALTAFAMQEDRERLNGAGFSGYISKPIEVKRFVAQVRSYFIQKSGEE